MSRTEIQKRLYLCVVLELILVTWNRCCRSIVSVLGLDEVDFPLCTEFRNPL